MRLQNITGSELRGLYLTAAAGEVVGFAGLPQSGIAEIPKIMSGGTARLGGTLEIAGQPIRVRATPATCSPPGSPRSPPTGCARAG